MAIADLQERKTRGFRRLRFAHNSERVRHATRNGPQHTRAAPGHAFQDLAAADAVAIVAHCKPPLAAFNAARENRCDGTALLLKRPMNSRHLMGFSLAENHLHQSLIRSLNEGYAPHRS